MLATSANHFEIEDPVACLGVTLRRLELERELEMGHYAGRGFVKKATGGIIFLPNLGLEMSILGGGGILRKTHLCGKGKYPY
jgi:hypothetical protein